MTYSKTMQIAIGIEAASFCSFGKRYSGKPGPAFLGGNLPKNLSNLYIKVIRIKIIQTKPELPKYNGF